MKIDNYQFPQSSFLSLEKDYSLIIDKIIKNKRLQKLLYYNTPDALSRADLTASQLQQVLQTNIKLTPNISIDPNLQTYIVISFDNFSPTENPEFRDNDIIFDIICHPDVWLLTDYQVRIFKIAGELDAMLNKKRLTGIGTLEFIGATQIATNQKGYYDFCIMYRTVHGGEDKVGSLNPANDTQLIADFNEMYNQ